MILKKESGCFKEYKIIIYKRCSKPKTIYAIYDIREYINIFSIPEKKKSFFDGRDNKVPRKWFGSADCNTIYTIYPSLCTQSADLNLFRRKAGCKH